MNGPAPPELTAFLEEEALPADYLDLVDRWISPLARWVRSRRALQDDPLLLGVHGAQGSGKSTLCQVLKILLCSEGQRVALLSLDDFYLERGRRMELARNVHPLFATRGVPGTHDLKLLQDCIDDLINGREARIPVFDKALDDRLEPAQWRECPAGVDIVLLEGWCIGCPPAEGDITEPVNRLEREEDVEGHWRLAVDQALAGEYAQLFDRLQGLVMLRVPSMEQVFEWRGLQEQKLAQTRAGVGVMDSAALERFIQHYERLTRRALQHLPAHVDYLLDIDARHHIVAGGEVSR